MLDLIVFLAGVVVVSLSGVMAPGPVTAATVALGTRSRHAGGLVAVGHGVVELPLVVLIIAGLDEVFQSQQFQLVVGLAGGAFLLFLGVQMMRSMRDDPQMQSKTAGRGPVMTGIVLSAGNPYFLLWWATVGLALASTAARLGVLAFGLFAVLHWLCDLVWLELLSWASFKGSRLLGERSQRVVLAICAAALFVFAVIFMGSGAKLLLEQLS